MSRLPLVLALAGLAALAPEARAQRAALPSAAAVRRAAEGLVADGMRAEIARLSDDSVRGRTTPSPELDKAAAYLAGEFQRLGLRPAGDSGTFLQRYAIRCTQADTASFVELAAGGAAARLRLGTTLAAMVGGLAEGETTGPVVLWAGAPTDTADAFGALDLRGATVVALAPASSLRSGDVWMPHVLRAQRGGAARWVMLTDIPERQFAARAASAARPTCAPGVAAGGSGPSVVAAIDTAAVLGVLRAAGVDVAAALASPTLVVRAAPGVTARARGTSRLASERTAPNVVAVLPGADPAVSAEHLVVMAHMDHLGLGRPVNGDSVYNGADDNASGTAGVLEVARAFGRLGVAPRRSIVFLAVSGEEEGLWGSEHFVAHPTVPLAQTVAALDMDMISRGWRDSVSVIGLDFSDLGATIRRVAQEHAGLVAQPVIDHWPEQNFLYRSDHINFARAGVPILYFLDGTPAEYHRLNDAVETIDAEAAARIARLVFLTTLDVANAAARPVWDAAARRRIGGN